MTMNAKVANSKSDYGLDPTPLNHYNLYFILERELFLQENGVYPAKERPAPTNVDYSGLDLPPLA